MLFIRYTEPRSQQGTLAITHIPYPIVKSCQTKVRSPNPTNIRSCYLLMDTVGVPLFATRVQTPFDSSTEVTLWLCAG